MSGAERVVYLMRRWGLTYATAVEVNQILTVMPALRITSGRRGRVHNRVVGGKPNSRHLKGTAVDLVGPKPYLAAARHHAWLTAAVEILDEGDHTHLAWAR